MQRNPIHPGGFHRHPPHAVPLQILRQLANIGREGAELTHRLMRHGHKIALAADVDGRHFGLDLVDLYHRFFPSLQNFAWCRARTRDQFKKSCQIGNFPAQRKRYIRLQLQKANCTRRHHTLSLISPNKSRKRAIESTTRTSVTMHGAKRSASLSSFTLLIAHAGSASRNDTLYSFSALFKPKACSVSRNDTWNLKQKT
jgi:hypothetical protein